MLSIMRVENDNGHIEVMADQDGVLVFVADGSAYIDPISVSINDKQIDLADNVKATGHYALSIDEATSIRDALDKAIAMCREAGQS